MICKNNLFWEQHLKILYDKMHSHAIKAIQHHPSLQKLFLMLDEDLS